MLKYKSRPPVFTPVFNARNFPQPTKIDNRYFPLVPGTIFIYEAIQGPREHDEFVVTQDTKEVLGVDCVVVRDKPSVNGEVVEDTFDYFAQDKYGNVLVYGRRYKTAKARGGRGNRRDMAGRRGRRHARVRDGGLTIRG
jgi:hypothetical protein